MLSKCRDYVKLNNGSLPQESISETYGGNELARSGPDLDLCNCLWSTQGRAF